MFHIPENEVITRNKVKVMLNLTLIELGREK